MSNTRIIGGGHDPNVTLVTKDGQIKTSSENIDSVEYNSAVHTSVYEFNPPRFALVNNKDMPLVWIKNTSSTFEFHFKRFSISTNGGNTTPHDKQMIIKIYRNAVEPTDDVTSGQFGASNAPHNLNISRSTNPEIDFKFWDGTGIEGMQLSGPTPYSNDDKGDQINCAFFAPGYTLWDYYGGLILEPGGILMLSAEIEQDADTGEIIIATMGYFRKNNIGIL